MVEQATQEDDQSGARSLERALAVLSLFAEVKAEWKIPEMSERLGVPLASMYRVVRVLSRSGYLEWQRPAGTLRLGLPFVRLGALVLSELDIRDVARPLMRAMAADLGETVLLMIPVPDGAVCIENVEGSYPIRLKSFTIGEQVPYNAGAGSLAILAFLSQQEQERILRGPFTSITSSTLTEASLIRERCNQIRASGVSHSEGEVVPGTSAIASPIFSGGEEEVTGAIVLTGLIERIERHRSAVRSVAREITRRLGGDPATFPGNDESLR